MFAHEGSNVPLFQLPNMETVWQFFVAAYRILRKTKWLYACANIAYNYIYLDILAISLLLHQLL